MTEFQKIIRFGERHRSKVTISLLRTSSQFDTGVRQFATKCKQKTLVKGADSSFGKCFRNGRPDRAARHLHASLDCLTEAKQKLKRDIRRMMNFHGHPNRRPALTSDE